jgi:ATP-dependent Lhr-like helicase
MEARGEIRGGRFVSGFAGEQFALAEAVELLRGVAKDRGADRTAFLAADPLNLVGILTPGERLPGSSINRVLFVQGVPVAIESGGEIRYLNTTTSSSHWEAHYLLIRRQLLTKQLSSSTTSH